MYRRVTTPKHPITRPRYIARWLIGAGVPGLREDGSFIGGLSGISIRVGQLKGAGNKSAVKTLMDLPWANRKYIHVVPSRGGQGIQDSVALVRLDFLAELLLPYIEENKDRLFRKED